MKTSSYQAIVALVVIGIASMFSAPRLRAQKPSIPAEERPFWESAQAFVDAYARRDAEALGRLFTEDAEFYDEFGERTEGRAAIVAMFQDVFQSTPDALIHEIRIERVRRITDAVALEEGLVVSSETADGPPYQTRYVALHTRDSDGRWRINTLKDYPRHNAGRREQLEQLAWLLGKWVNEEADSVVRTTCRWSEDGNYLLRRFTIQTFDGREMTGVQRIGWDPVLKKLRSWTFDSEGGFFQGVWTKDGNQWLVTTAGITADGKMATGTAVYTIIDREMISWQYRSLIVGDEVVTDLDPVRMVRPPPAPQQGS